MCAAFPARRAGPLSQAAREIDQAVIARLRAAGCVFAEDEARVLVDAARTRAELDAMVDAAGRRRAA